MNTEIAAEIKPVGAQVNGIQLNVNGEDLSANDLRQRACSELLRQAAMEKGLLPATDLPSVDGVMNEDASSAIERLLAQEVLVPEPSEDACRRYHAANQGVYSTGERIRVRHILFAVTQGVDVTALRNRAETSLLDVRCHDGKSTEDKFAKTASTLSNCPSGAEGGNLGWLTTQDCAPEFSKELFGHAEVGVLPRLVHSRFGLHIVEVLEREPGVEQSFDAVRGAVTMALRQKSYVTALRQYLRLLAGTAVLEGVDIEASNSPLVQ
ncbi:peptidylprolyl isomerase [Rhodoferax sp. PAMC 29310]|uniref:peptidylprolyl isomerase n=1 Tax=Rhodoferax sp. PAMC 29310 TaxID=2822760 RepID=UPI001B3200D8|nr:peptidylprolyl isomerase [Rhodoferax sp. PAMC 29310]